MDKSLHLRDNVCTFDTGLYCSTPVNVIFPNFDYYSLYLGPQTVWDENDIGGGFKFDTAKDWALRFVVIAKHSKIFV